MRIWNGAVVLIVSICTSKLFGPPVQIPETAREPTSEGTIWDHYVEMKWNSEDLKVACF